MRKMLLLGFSCVLLTIVILACATTDQAVLKPGIIIHLNQVGYLADSYKAAVIMGDAAQFVVVDAQSGAVVFQSSLGAPRYWEASGETVRLADFSSLSTEGSYRLQVGDQTSILFRIDAQIYQEVGTAALKAYFFNRAGMALEEQYAGVYARPAGHPDSAVQIHVSAASALRPEGSLIVSPKGWYDAGDYNKYIVNSAITVSTLMSLFEHYPQAISALTTNIPESGNTIPDLLDEVRYNLDWMLTMQDSGDGGVYHKLSSLNFEDFIRPEDASAPRFVVMKTTSASLDFTASMAQAGRVYQPFDGDFAAACLLAAEKAWSWAQEHPDVAYIQPGDVQTGTYSQNRGSFADESFWAATELALTRGENLPDLPREALQVPEWANPAVLGVMDRLTRDEEGVWKENFLKLADSLLAQHARIPYAVSNQVFRWGSNSDFLNQALVLIRAHSLTGVPAYRAAAQGDFDWVMGKNPLGISFVTGFGAKTPLHIHHRPSESDGIEAPQPGWVAGGPNPGNKYDCGEAAYPSPFPALAYVDQLCSYATNEIAINWNAPFVYVAFALMATP